VHTSDVHVGNESRTVAGSEWPEVALAHLAGVVEVARAESAHALLITGDFFDHNRVKEELCAMAGQILGRAGMPVVVLPGNHDPYMPQSPYVRCRALFPDNVRIIAREEGELVVLEEAGIQVWGQAHARYDDFAPLSAAPAWREDGALWRVAVGHAHYVASEFEKRYSYLVHDHELQALQAHYVGLGHLEKAETIGPVDAHAWYAGSPEILRGATVIDLTADGTRVRQAPFARQDYAARDGFPVVTPG
jgi:DNA repair exonuclease SbcCD nuclease subunit